MTIAQENLVALWKLDDNSASTVVLDSSGNGYHGTSVRNTNLMHVAGKIDGAFDLSNLTDSVNTNNKFLTAFRNSFTISCWAKLTLLPTSQNIISSIDPTTDFITLAVTNTGVVLAQYFNNSGGITVFDAIEPFNVPPQWKMVTFIITQLPTSIQADGYVNTELIFTAQEDDVVMSTYNSSTNIQVGGNTNGYLDDVRIYNKALNIDEIRQLYNEPNEGNIIESDWSF
jgi:hypothetical protein